MKVMKVAKVMKVNEGYEGYVIKVMRNLDYWSRLYSSGGSEKL